MPAVRKREFFISNKILLGWHLKFWCLWALSYLDVIYQANTLIFVQVYVDTLVKKAYENWHQVIEYDGKALLNSKQTRRTRSSQNDLSINALNYSNAIDNQLAIPRLPIAVSTEQALLENSVSAPGKRWLSWFHCWLHYLWQAFENFKHYELLQRKRVFIRTAKKRIRYAFLLLDLSLKLYM